MVVDVLTRDDTSGFRVDLLHLLHSEPEIVVRLRLAVAVVAAYLNAFEMGVHDRMLHTNVISL